KIILQTLYSTVLLTMCGAANADTVEFKNIAADPAMNLHFERARSSSYDELLTFYKNSQHSPVSAETVLSNTPHRTGGFPGVALIDHDNDGDTDIYVTNGPGAMNGLFVNQISDTGEFHFINASGSFGAEATEQDSNGVCFGDLDNDGDEDLYVLGRESNNFLFENKHGQFHQVYEHGAEGGNESHISCSMGDIDGDGLLDIAVSNIFFLDNALALGAVPYELNQRNQLFRNRGNLEFEDVTESSGILNMSLGGTDDPQPPTISWAVAMVDIDQDGDTDILFGDDQAGLPNAARGGFDRGYLQVFLNDGSGYFINAPIALNENSSAAWMALGFGDLDCNGTTDIVGSNLGSYMFEAFGLPSNQDAEATRWLLGNGDGSFFDPQSPFASAFGWGNGVADLDNDGDQDILYHGAMDLNNAITHDNPGIVLLNQDCTATFEENYTAFRGEYTTRGTQGVATGDLDQDGYIDVVTVSNHNIPTSMPFFNSPAQYGSVLDDTARYYLPMLTDPVTQLLSWNGIETLPGDMTVEINQGSSSDTPNGSISIRAKGSKGLLRKAQSNRSGVSAVISFTPQHKPTTHVPVVAGSSFTSQHALEAHFGMGQSETGTLDILWQGGVKNRLYGVRAGERLTIPEIPCSIDSRKRYRSYKRCVLKSLRQLAKADQLEWKLRWRLYRSAMRAYFDNR
nr:VCBS repeat-containing protein [Granulosicoccus sp.]